MLLTSSCSHVKFLLPAAFGVVPIRLRGLELIWLLHHTHESLKLCFVFWLRHFLYGSHFIHVRFQSVFAQHMPYVTDSLSPILHLFQFSFKFILLSRSNSFLSLLSCDSLSSPPTRMSSITLTTPSSPSGCYLEYFCGSSYTEGKSLKPVPS